MKRLFSRYGGLVACALLFLLPAGPARAQQEAQAVYRLTQDTLMRRFTRLKHWRFRPGGPAGVGIAGF